ncbi:MAG: hypothetical protein N2442_14090 [Spirochaetes bacterium]|nr:hypothetical protein [Spirochaetota bacterium]
MRVAIVYFAPKHRDTYRTLAEGIARGLISRGAQVDVIDGETEKEKRLSLYEYIIMGCEPASLFGKKIPTTVDRFLSQAGSIGGKRSCAFIGKHLFASSRALSQLMKSMEREGMFLTYSEILSNRAQAEQLGIHLLT